MTDLLSQIQIVLQNGGYDTWLLPQEDSVVVGFEDASAMGFAFIFTDASSLLETWRSREHSLLIKHALNLKRADEKVWNLYSIFLSSATPNDQQIREVRQIDENQERTRKIAACGLTALEDITQALLPILPIQHQPRLDTEDIAERFRKRIMAIAPTVADAIFDETIPPDKLALLLGDGK